MIAQLNSRYIKMRPLKAVIRLIAYFLFEGRPLTTRGRWINPLVFAHFRLLNILPTLTVVKKPIFILGTGRSGTTFLGLLLSMHKEVGFLNEPKALWHAVFPEEDIIGSYNNGPARYRLSEAEANQAITQKAHKLYGAFLALSGSQRVVDKYPELLFRIPFVKQIFPDAIFVLLIRNGVETCQSIKKWSSRFEVRKGKEVHDWWGKDRRKWNCLLEQIVRNDKLLGPIYPSISSFTRQEDMALVEWIVSMREGLHQLEKYPQCMTIVRFEDLMNRPVETLTSLLQFCDLGPDKIFYDFARSAIVPPPSHGSFDIPAELKPYFRDTMNRFGY